MATFAQILAAGVKWIAAGDKAEAIVNGPASGAGSTVVVTSGTIPTFPKVIADAEAAFDVVSADAEDAFAEVLAELEAALAAYNAPLALTAAPVNGDVIATTITLADYAGLRGTYGYTTSWMGRVRIQHTTNPGIVFWNGSQWNMAYNGTTYYHSLDNVLYPWLVTTWVADNVSFPVLPVLTTPALGTVAVLHQEAVATIAASGMIYSFKCVKAPSTWTPLTSGVLWDPNPPSGVARYRRLVFTGSGDDHTTTYSDL